MKFAVRRFPFKSRKVLEKTFYLFFKTLFYFKTQTLLFTLPNEEEENEAAFSFDFTCDAPGSQENGDDAEQGLHLRGETPPPSRTSKTARE